MIKKVIIILILNMIKLKKKLILAKRIKPNLVKCRLVSFNEEKANFLLFKFI